MKILDGKKASEEILSEIKEQVSARQRERQRSPHLVAVLVGAAPASEAYVANKIRACKQVGFQTSLLRYPVGISQQTILDKLAYLNRDEGIDGVLVQLPLPKHIMADSVTDAIEPGKDVDGFHPENLGLMLQNRPRFLPATPAGIVELLRRNSIGTQGKHCVVVGRSGIVGTPISIMLSRDADPGNCTVTLCHSKTLNLAYYTQEADILVVAAGKPGLIGANHVKEGAVVVDVGIHRQDDDSKKSGYSLVGDVCFDEVAPKCLAITPVPGGVGPMTIAMLLKNTMRACELRAGNGRAIAETE